MPSPIILDEYSHLLSHICGVSGTHDIKLRGFHTCYSCMQENTYHTIAKAMVKFTSVYDNPVLNGNLSKLVDWSSLTGHHLE